MVSHTAVLHKLRFDPLAHCQIHWKPHLDLYCRDVVQSDEYHDQCSGSTLSRHTLDSRHDSVSHNSMVGCTCAHVGACCHDP
jgi:hypothetical protein